jgi:hypothetical protein
MDEFQNPRDFENLRLLSPVIIIIIIIIIYVLFYDAVNISNYIATYS